MPYTFRLIKGSALTWAELDDNFSTMDQQYTDSLASSLIALGAANFKGNWNSLVGALNKPASVRHSSKYWVLLNNLADVTASQPGVSGDWAEINAGNVVGPVSAVNNNIALFDGVTGKLIKDSAKALPSGTVVGTTDSQVLTNKTLTAPTITAAVAEVVSLNGGQLAGLRNRLINGNFSVWQRGTSFAATTTPVYTADRWSVQQQTTANCTVTRQTNALGGYSCRVQRNSGSGSTGNISLAYTAESIDSNNLRNKQMVLSFRAKAGANFSSASSALNLRIRSNNSTEVSSTTVHIGTGLSGIQDTGTVTLTATETLYSVTATIPADHTQFGVVFFFAPVGTAGTNDWFEISEVQFEVSSVATPFEQHPYGMELALCQRYYQRVIVDSTGDSMGNGGNNTTTTTVILVPFNVAMRIAPAALEQSGTAGNYQVFHGNTTTACSAVPTYNRATQFNASIIATVTSGLTVGQAAALTAASTAAYLGFSAEL